jgi:hypothetical protein
MLPETAQKPILSMLRDFIDMRIGLGVPYDPTKLERDITRSLDLQARLWKEAVAVTATAPQSLPPYRFVARGDGFHWLSGRRARNARARRHVDDVPDGGRGDHADCRSGPAGSRIHRSIYSTAR